LLKSSEVDSKRLHSHHHSGRIMGKKRKKQTRPRRGNQKRRSTGTLEWVGGRLTTPFYVTEGDPYRPEIILWLELPNDLVVGHMIIDPKGPLVSFGETLLHAMAMPMVGPPRRPARIRVADARLADEVQKTAPDIDVVVEPTPELDRLLALMRESMSAEGDDDMSYFEGGRISGEAVDSLFHAAQLLYEISPWKAASDSQVLRLDIPALGVEGACVSVIGALGESLGFIIFPSCLAFERFYRAAEAGNSVEGPLDWGTDTLSLNFERGAELPTSMRREVAEHGWPVADPMGYPLVRHLDRDGVLRPLNEHDIRVVSACATSLSAFFLKHGVLFEREVFEPVCESFFDEDDLEVRFTFPYRAAPLFTANDPHPSLRPEWKKGKPGRNAPCPCGSGKKYKKCCLGKDEASKAPARTPAMLHEMDHRIIEDMMEFASRRFGHAWFRAAEDFDDHEAAAQLFSPWSVYHFVIDGRSVVRWFIEEHRHVLSKTQLEWLGAQQGSWLSLWEVTEVTPGIGLTLRDLLTEKERTVHEIRGSKSVVKRDVLLCRIVDYQGLSLLSGSHPRPLPPLKAAEVIRRVRGRLRRKRTIPVERLQHEKIGRYMIARWEEAVEELDMLRGIPPRLQNTDGDALLFTVDHFRFDPAVRTEIQGRLASLEGAEVPEPQELDQAYVFTVPGNAVHGSWKNTVVGRAWVLEAKLRLETNSLRRADALRDRVEAACVDLIRHYGREHSDPFSPLHHPEERHDVNREPAEIPPAEAAALVREFKESHYADWADEPLPALNGKTPREAVRSKAGRTQVELLLKHFENQEARAPDEERFDFSGIRRDLGLGP
jgi:hypothetical protein